MKVLVVDDDVDTLALLSMLLVRHGFEADVASSVSDGKKALSNVTYDVLIADLHLPDGLGTLLLLPMRPKSLRAAILVTGGGDDAERRLSRDLGFDHCMIKPVEFNYLIARIRSAIGEGEEKP